MGRERHNITIDGEVWKAGGEVLASIGMTKSKFIEIVFRGLMRSSNTVYGDVVGDMYGDLFANAKIVPKEEKPK